MQHANGPQVVFGHSWMFGKQQNNRRDNVDHGDLVFLYNLAESLQFELLHDIHCKTPIYRSEQ